MQAEEDARKGERKQERERELQRNKSNNHFNVYHIAFSRLLKANQVDMHVANRRRRNKRKQNSK